MHITKNSSGYRLYISESIETCEENQGRIDLDPNTEDSGWLNVIEKKPVYNIVEDTTGCLSLEGF